jgi:hypothetical protein
VDSEITKPISNHFHVETFSTNQTICSIIKSLNQSSRRLIRYANYRSPPSSSFLCVLGVLAVKNLSLSALSLQYFPVFAAATLTLAAAATVSPVPAVSVAMRWLSTGFPPRLSAYQCNNGSVPRPSRHAIRQQLPIQVTIGTV